jgi:hypothetical protein
MEELLQPVIQNGKLTSAGRQSVSDFKGNREYIRDQVNKTPGPWEGKKALAFRVGRNNHPTVLRRGLIFIEHECRTAIETASLGIHSVFLRRIHLPPRPE